MDGSNGTSTPKPPVPASRDRGPSVQLASYSLARQYLDDIHENFPARVARFFLEDMLAHLPAETLNRVWSEQNRPRYCNAKRSTNDRK